jgi:hypothetical protein
MAKSNDFWVGIICALILGGLLVYGFMPREVVNEVEVEIPGEVITVIEYVNQTVETEGEFDFESTYLDAAHDEFLDEYEEDSLYLECDGVEYDEDEIELKWFKDFGVSVDDDDWEDYSVFYSVKFKYLDDADEKCYQTFDVEVDYEEDETPVVSAVLA